MNDYTGVLANPFFWAAVSLSAIPAGDAIVSNVLPRSRALGVLVVGTFMLGRTVLVLPLCPQPRFEMMGLYQPCGALIIAIGAAVLLPVFRVAWTTGPEASERLRTTGIYSFVRHPGYLGNLLLGLGWAVLFGSVLGVALTAVWWLSFFCHSLIEEAELLRTYGVEYEHYKHRVAGRLLPGLPV